MEKSRLVLMGFSAGGWLDGSMSVWQPVHPITLWTDCAKASPGMCNESDSPLASCFSSPGAPWQARHFPSPSERAAADADAVIPARASTTAAVAAPIVPIAKGLRPILPLKLGFITCVSAFSSDSLWPRPERTTAIFCSPPALLHATAAPVFDSDQTPRASQAEGTGENSWLWCRSPRPASLLYTTLSGTG